MESQPEYKFKVIGTRPLRHDGVDKVTGRAKYGADAEASIDLTACMRMGAAQHFPVQHSRQANIGAIFGATGDFVDSIMPNRTRADDFELILLLRFHAHLLCQP